MIKSLFIILALVFVSDGRQEYMQDYMAIVGRYKGSPSISYTIQFKSFDTRADRPDTVLIGKYQIKGNKVHSRIGAAEMIATGKYVLRVDHQHKVAFINYASRSGDESSPLAILDSTIRKYKCAISYADGPAPMRKYKVEYGVATGHSNTMTMEFDKGTHLISKMTMYMDPEENPYEEAVKKPYKPFVDFVYGGYSFAEIPDAAFSIDQYVEINGKTVKPKPAFAKYQIINSLVYNQENR